MRSPMMAEVVTAAWLWAFLLFTASLPVSLSKEDELVESWAVKLGEELWELGLSVTKAPEIRARYKTLNARVLPTDGEAILKSIVSNVNKMMKDKMDSVMCVIERAEELADDFIYDESSSIITSRNLSTSFPYHNAKYSPVLEDADQPNIKPIRFFEEAEFIPIYKNMSLTPERHFYGIPVNTSYSAVHVPTDIFDQGHPVLESIQWSEGLNDIFVENYMSDPTLSWQYFGSTTGIMRHYPALRWNDQDVDVFDCRMRSWYIEATTCSKDVIILLDNSGSMRGMTTTIARLTANMILETFSNNDFINIFSFNLTVQELIPCFHRDTLVQATLENIKQFQEAVSSLSKPDDKADFPQALGAAFKLLEQYRETTKCPERVCNQAIMLVTDGVPDNLTEVFERFNWFENRTHIPVRVFTYLIGREVTKVREIQWMACLNRGYYVHIKTLYEVREQVLKYIPVIARPLVLQAVEHPLSWTHALADIDDPKMSSWLWDVMDFKDQQERLSHHVRNKNINFSQRNEDSKYVQRPSKESDETGSQFQQDKEVDMIFQEYRLMTSVSGPAFDRRKNQNNKTRVAELLGVAGTDVKIRNIEKLTLPYKIGANGYAFVITNNGYLLMHPDLRPVYKGELKENYNSVDLTEVEFLDDDKTEPREPSPQILKLREAMVNHVEGSTLDLKMKFHYDDMRRVGTETRNYYYAPLKNTPFTMGLVLPHSYGNYWIKAGDEVKKSMQMGIPLTSYFKGNWRVHPDWVYCDYHRTSSGTWYVTREAKLLHFLKKMESPSWQWTEQFAPEQETIAKDDLEPNQTYNCNSRRTIDDEKYFCDKELMQLLVFDAKSTEASYKTSKWAARTRREAELVERFGASLRFAATQSGLTRWQHIPELAEGDRQYGDSNNQALGEPWYRSAVLQHHLDPEAFVFSVAFDSGGMTNLTVTASHAIFPRDGGHEAPGSVVGLHIQHSALLKRFMEITNNENCKDCECEECCASDALDCYVIDGNGYIVMSEVINETGRFFGETEGAIMEALVFKNIFRRVPMFDYQGLCYRNILVPKDDEFEIKRISESCDLQSNLYVLQHLSKEGYHSVTPINCSRPFFVKRIPHTNLLLVVVKALHQSCYRVLNSTMTRIVYNSTDTQHPNCQKLNLNTLHRRGLSGCYNEHPLEIEIDKCGNGRREIAGRILLFVCALLMFSRIMF